MAKKRSKSEAERHEVIKQIGELSSGTIASLTGERHYEVLETIRENLRLFVIGALMSGRSFKNWQEAWAYYDTEAQRQSRRS